MCSGCVHKSHSSLMMAYWTSSGLASGTWGGGGGREGERGEGREGEEWREGRGRERSGGREDDGK